MRSILVVGSVALDTVSTPAGESREALGGSATYFSLAARGFAPVSLVGVVGKDFPSAHRELLSSRGVDCSGLETAAGRTFRWSGRYGADPDAAETLETQLNVFANFRPRLGDAHRRAPVVFLANIDPDLQSGVLDQMRAPALIACDTMNYWIHSKPESLKKLLGRVHVFFCNETEAESLAGTPNALQAAERIAEWGPAVVVVKKGEHGAFMRARGRVYSFPAFPHPLIKDPTGAGDSFAGGFLGSLAEAGRWDDLGALKRAMIYGTALASYNVEDFSTRRLESLERAHIDERFHDLIERMTVPVPSRVPA